MAAPGNTPEKTTERHKRFETKVTAVEEIAHNTFLLRFEKPFDLCAGQVVAVTTDIHSAPRLYSVCSGESDEDVQILFDVKNDGALTPNLAALRQGDPLWVSEPYGSFLPKSKVPMWWVASGTGIAPYYAMLRSGYRPVQLLHGARRDAQFYFDREFEQTLGNKYIRCCSTDAGGDYRGRVTDYLLSRDALPLNHFYFLCGSATMVVEARDILISKWVPFQNVITEIYF